MNKKILTSIVTLGMIATSAANAAVTKEQCNRSDKTVWVENVANADGTRGACVPKNACKSDNFKKDFCVTAFKDINVSGVGKAEQLVRLYAKKVLGWTQGCSQIFDIDINNSIGQDYMGCYSNGNYMVFEFDDTHENLRPTGEAELLAGVCIALKGRPENNTRIDVPNVRCYGLSADTCANINGGAVTLYNDADSSCKLDDGSVFKWLAENAQ